MPKVSVIISTYNRSEYICEAIDSVLGQTYKDFEIIVIDDGSKDNTREILRKYGDRIKYIYQENKGISVARNRGIKEARGEYIALLDSDDIWFPEKLEKQISILEKEKQISLIYSCLKIMENGKIRQEIKPFFPALDFYDLLIGWKSIPLSASVIRRSCLDNVGTFDETLQATQDYDLWLRIMLRYKVRYLDYSLGIYRKHNNNLSKNIELVKKEGVRIYKKLLMNKDIPKKMVKKKLSMEYYALGKIYHDQKRYKEGSISIRNAIFIYPLVGLNFIFVNENIKNKIIKLMKPYFVFLYLIALSLLKNKKS